MRSICQKTPARQTPQSGMWRSQLSVGLEVVTNGSMETDPSVQWIQNVSVPILTQVADEHSDGTGTHSLDLQISATGVDMGLVVQTIALTAGKQYRLSGWVKNIDATYATIVVWNNAYSTLALLDNLAATTWNRSIQEFVCTGAAGFVALVLHGAQGTHVRYDDISIREIFR